VNLTGCMPVRNEDWVLGLSARVALMWCDQLIVLEHHCIDNTHKILFDLTLEFQNRVTVIRDPDPAWDEMTHRQRLLGVAREKGATHIAIVDADEVLTANLVDSVRVMVERGGFNGMMNLPGYNLRRGLYQYHENGIWGERWFATVFQDSPLLSWQGDQFHHRTPFGKKFQSYNPVPQGAGGVMHLWGASERRLVAKHALYKMTEVLRWPAKDHKEVDREYNQAIMPTANLRFDQNWNLAPVPKEWWDGYGHLMHYLNVDGMPWQEAEIWRLWKEHGPERFAGLNLFGLVE
jgi:hypothetical protein